MKINRLLERLNNTQISERNPETGETRNLSAKKIVTKIKEAIRHAVVYTIIIVSVVTGSISYMFADQVAEWKNQHQYYDAVGTVYASEQKAMKEAYSDSYQGKRMDTAKEDTSAQIVELVDSQRLCEAAYPDKLLQFIFAPVIVDKCNDPDCEDCNHNRHVEQEVNEILSQMPEYADIVSMREVYQGRSK